MDNIFSKMATGNIQPDQMVIVGGEEEGAEQMLYSIQSGGGMQVKNISPVQQAILQAKSKVANRKRGRSSSKHHSSSKRRRVNKGGKKTKRAGKKRKTTRKRTSRKKKDVLT
jgi:hypothetical protein